MPSYRIKTLWYCLCLGVSCKSVSHFSIRMFGSMYRKATPTCVPSPARNLGSCLHQGSTLERKSIFIAAAHEKKTRNKCINTHERGSFLIYGNIYAPVLHLTLTGLPSAVPPEHVHLQNPLQHKHRNH